MHSCFRVYSGGRAGPQIDRFLAAAANASKQLPTASLVFEEMTLKSMRENAWSMTELVDWLLGSHCHFIICHPHQNTLGLGWNVVELYYTELQRLKYHRGFPCMDKLLCPVFTQDKIRYLEALPEGRINPTLKIPLCRDMWKTDLSATMDTVTEWVNDHRAGTRFIMKPGYTTNSLHYKKCVDTVEEVKLHLNRVMNDMYGGAPTCYEVPYIMLQVRVSDNSEVKLVFLNKQYSHMVSSDSKLIRMSLRGFKESELIAFAKETLDLLPEDEYILDGMVRVDIFRNDDGYLVLNEFESLEATYFTKSVTRKGNLEDFLEAYWERKFYDALLS